MSFFRSLLLLSVISLSIAAGFLFIGSTQTLNEYRGGYAALAVDDSIEDRTLRSLLDDGNRNFGGPPVHESSQWVMLDEFGSLGVVPLDDYSKRIQPYDPRNDGYAEKLKYFFVRDGKRFVYIPLRADNSVSSSFEKQLAGMLGDIPFTVNYSGIGKPLRLFFALFTAAVLCLSVICYVQKNRRPGAAGIVFLLPVLSSLAFFGAAGIAAAALLLGLSVLLREPLYEFNMLLQRPSATRIARRRLFFRDVFEQYKLHWFILPVFAVALGIIVFFSQIRLLFILAASVIVCALFFFSIRAFSLLGGKHRRFTPVLIIKSRFPDFAFSVYMIPFSAAAFLVMLFTSSVPGAMISGENFEHVIDEQEYYAHLAFQASFSMRQLGGAGFAYPGYVLDEDGLPVPGMKTETFANAELDSFPPFPLKHLMDFLSGVDTGNRSVPDAGRGVTPENLLPLILLLFILPGFFFKEKDHFPQKDRFSGHKKPGKLRRIDIDRKKVLLYNIRNTLLVRKDA